MNVHHVLMFHYDLKSLNAVFLQEGSFKVSLSIQLHEWISFNE